MGAAKADRWSERGTRPVRVANCSGYKADPGYNMRMQAELGDVDFITGDYLAEVNIAENAEAMAAGNHPGWEATAWDGIEQTIDILNEKRIKVVVNGGAQNPRGLAEKVLELVKSRGYSLKVAYVEGDNLLPKINQLVEEGLPAHLDSGNADVNLPKNSLAVLDKSKPIVAANAYLGAREIVKGLELGADIVIAGRVADASPVIGAAQYWHGWSATSYDELAGALVAGHLIECSAYVTGANFSGFHEYDLDNFYEMPFGIAEIAKDGSVVATKHDNTKGMVTVDTVQNQFLYELQGNVYLNSDVKAYIENVKIEEVGKDRVRLSGIRGAPPPPTTKLGIFYRGGFHNEILVNATGYSTAEKWDLYERIMRNGLRKQGTIDDFDLLEFQILGVPQPNPRSQQKSTTYMRIFAEAAREETLYSLVKTMGENSMQHFSAGFHCSLDMRTAVPRPYLAFYPALFEQDRLETAVNVLDNATGKAERYETGHPPKYDALEKRLNYNTDAPAAVSSFGPTQSVRLGDIALGRSGDKGPNVNFGVYMYKPRVTSESTDQDAWNWFRSFMSRERMQELLDEDWRDEYFIERVEFPRIGAVHFVIYGILGRGVSSSARLDALGKGFADYIRDKVIEVPEKFLVALRRNGESKM
ncbi:DUF1446 domain-containing protein [Eremomyces bilateralis CBS 781.70]|uniref:DUF1446 domain-containing protein n=1 Tax=Eremomyces bilateralis CBS 781.70 TaxID=1392243 RepID=A0A6G1G1Z9_9PEZI|nr:DUF1446 domain-containing protein [Eremomyces bilateralis CBS 781.70]KAF1812012.1 DUF1446 domain-containing protein [Eremomyces bilateralis CBS 781.70]